DTARVRLHPRDREPVPVVEQNVLRADLVRSDVHLHRLGAGDQPTRDDPVVVVGVDADAFRATGRAGALRHVAEDDASHVGLPPTGRRSPAARVGLAAMTGPGQFGCPGPTMSVRTARTSAATPRRSGR